MFSMIPDSYSVVAHCMCVNIYTVGLLISIQWNLRVKDTLVTIISAVLSFVERLYSFRGSKCIRAIGRTIFGTSTCVLCREVYYTVSLSRRVHYRRFHCSTQIAHTCTANRIVHVITVMDICVRLTLNKLEGETLYP